MSFTINAGQSASSAAGRVATGGDQAPLPDAISPIATNHVFAIDRAVARSKSGGFAVVVVSAAIPVVDGEDLTTFKGTLSVYACDMYGNLLGPISESLTVVDYSIDPPFDPVAGTVLRLNREPLDATVDPGQPIALVWGETGVTGHADDEFDTEGARPTYHVLGWPMIAVEPTSF